MEFLYIYAVYGIIANIVAIPIIVIIGIIKLVKMPAGKKIDLLKVMNRWADMRRAKPFYIMLANLSLYLVPFYSVFMGLIFVYRFWYIEEPGEYDKLQIDLSRYEF